MEKIFSLEVNRPEVTLMVNGVAMVFLCDSGACKTTCREPIPGAVNSNVVLNVRSANGRTERVPVSHPIWIRDPQGATCQMSVLIMPHCPVNLLGGDGLTALGLALIPTEDDRIVVRRKHELSGSDTYVLKEKGTPFYYYSLDVPNRPPMEVGKQSACRTLLHC